MSSDSQSSHVPWASWPALWIGSRVRPKEVCLMKQLGLATFVILICGAQVDARVVRIVIEKRESPAFRGQSFGAAGQYETLSGHFYGELNPKDAHNAIITDIQLAPRNARGMVEYSATFSLS